MNEALKKAATKGRGKRDQKAKKQWIDALNEAIRTDPCGTIIVVGEKGEAVLEKREYSARNAWVFEFMGKEQKWEYSAVLNLDKQEGAVRLTHTLKWCNEKLEAEKDLFLKGTYDKCRFRMRNLVDDNFIMLAVLV